MMVMLMDRNPPHLNKASTTKKSKSVPITCLWLTRMKGWSGNTCIFNEIPSSQPIQQLVPRSIFSLLQESGHASLKKSQIHFICWYSPMSSFPCHLKHTLDPLNNWDQMCSQLSNYPTNSLCVETHAIRPCSLPSSCYGLPGLSGMCFQLSQRHTCIQPSQNALITELKPLCLLSRFSSVSAGSQMVLDTSSFGPVASTTGIWVPDTHRFHSSCQHDR